MKNRNLLIYILLLFLAFWSVSAWSQYSWSERAQKEMGSDWKVFDEQKNTADLIYTYTIFNPPINRLGLIQLSSIEIIDNEIYKYDLMWTDGPLGIRMPTEVFRNYTDCKLLKEGLLKEGISEYRNVEDLQWKPPDDNPYVTSESDKKKLIEAFNRKCSILNLYRK